MPKICRMLKEKKKLLTKIDSLKRKVQSLQSKLATNVGPKPSPISDPDIVETTTAPTIKYFPGTASTSTCIPPHAPRLPEPTTPTPAPRPPTTRAVSGPSALPVPKSPGKKSAVPLAPAEARTYKPVAATLTPDLQPSNSSAGKKRKVPDEYEERAPPVQGFSVDCLPVNDVNTTPRRRVPRNSSGFTPVRNRSLTAPSQNHAGNARVPLSSSNVSNTPQQRVQTDDPSAKPTKRTWLGKIKGVTRQAAVAATNPAYERARSDVS